MFSEKAKKHADACRFCWMCRHLCPVQLVTGKETNTPRAKWLLVSELKMTEPNAHHYIEKQAMDRCVSKREIAEEIIKTYGC